MAKSLMDRAFLNVKDGLIEYNKKQNINFRISEDIYFEDLVWDFNNFNINKRLRSDYRFNFSYIEEPFRFGVKMVILNQLFRKSLKFSTARKTFANIRTVSTCFLNKGITDIRLLNIEIIEEYFNKDSSNLSRGINGKRARSLKLCLEEYSSFKGYDFDKIIDHLDKTIKNFEKKNNITSQNDYIPDRFLNQIVSLAIKDLDNENLSIRSRIISGLIVIMAETGMRVGEVSMLETNRLNTVGEGLEKLYYLDFYTFKISEHESEKRMTSTFLTPLALKAYKTLELFVSEIIEGLSEKTRLRLMIQVKEDKMLKGTVPITELRRLISEYSEEEIKYIEKEMRRFLFLDTKTGLQKRGSILLRTNMEEFYVRHHDELTLDGMTEKEKGKIKILQIKNESRYKKLFNVKERETIRFKDIKNEKYLYTNPHSFRVTLCTKLFRQGVHLDYIIRHLNHLSEDMTMYYNKSSEFERSLEDTVNIFIENSTSEGLIETDENLAKDGLLKEELKSMEFKKKIEKINKFLENGKLNLNVDMKKIVKSMNKTGSTLAENEFGVCIISLVQRICERRKYFSSIDDHYYIGIQLSTFEDINYSYKRFKEKLLVVEHNKIISEENVQFKNEYEREIKALKYFVKKSLAEELKYLEEEIEAKGEKTLSKEYPYLEEIIVKHSSIKKEIKPWVS